MEIKIVAVSGVTPFAAPHLQTGLGVPGEDGHRALGFRSGTHQVGLIGGFILLLRALLVLGREACPQALQGFEAILIDPNGAPAF